MQLLGFGVLQNTLMFKHRPLNYFFSILSGLFHFHIQHFTNNWSFYFRDWKIWNLPLQYWFELPYGKEHGCLDFKASNKIIISFNVFDFLYRTWKKMYLWIEFIALCICQSLNWNICTLGVCVPHFLLNLTDFFTHSMIYCHACKFNTHLWSLMERVPQINCNYLW